MNKFVQFYLDNKGLIYMRAMDICNGNYHNAEDLIQDVLLDLCQKKEIQEREGSLGAFWTTCLQYKQISKWKAKRSQIHNAALECWKSERKEIKKMRDIIHIEDSIDAKIVIEEIKNIKSDRVRQVIKLLADGNNQKDIAELLSIRYCGIGKHIRTGRRILRAKLIARGFDRSQFIVPRSISFQNRKLVA